MLGLGKNIVRSRVKRLGDATPPPPQVEDLPFLNDAVFYINRFYDNDVITDANGRVLEWVNRADNNNNLSRAGVADANLPVDNAVDKTVRLEKDNKLYLASDILYDSSNCTMVLWGKNDDYVNQGNVVLGENPTNSAIVTFWNFRTAGKGVFVYPGAFIQFSDDTASDNPTNAYNGKIINALATNRPNSQDHQDFYGENDQLSRTLSRNLSSNTTAFLNVLLANSYQIGEGFEIRGIIMYDKTLTPSELVTLRNYILNQYPITINP